MARHPISSMLWQQLQPFASCLHASVKGGPRQLQVSNEAALNGILFVLQTGIPGRIFPSRWAIAAA